MKMVKSLLLGSAAGLVAVAGAQAADLPVKAKPVEYVKVCSLYGAGFWYVPGTDTCLKIGSYVRVQTAWDAEGGGIPIGFGTGGGQFTRSDTNEFNYRARSALSVDLRTQTEYGTLRSYLEVGAELTTASSSSALANVPFFDRGFIQFAGFTAGKIRSYFDINSFAPYSYSNNRVSGDTGATGLYGIAYTAQFGNGVTASLSFEDGGSSVSGNNNGSAGGRGRFTVDAATAGFFAQGAQTLDNKGTTFPDVVGALRIDQAWGYAQVAAALHDASGAYYGATDLTGNGHPGDKVGFAVTGGFTLNDVLGLKGDQFGMQAAYAQGAAGYVTRASTPMLVYNGATPAMNWMTDGVFDTGTGVELTTTWGINGFYQHFWNPKWRTSLYGGYVEIDYNGTATSIINSHLGAAGAAACATTAAPGAATFVAITPAAGNACSPDSSWWQVGTRTQWNPHPDLDIGLDVLWTHLNTAYKGSATAIALSGAHPACASAGGGCNLDDQDVLSVLFRIQRNFLP
jgi:Porin subfamily